MRAHMKTRKHREIIRQALTELGVYTGSKLSFPTWFASHFEDLYPILKDRFQSASNDIQSRIAELLGRQLVVCSFAEQPKNLLMWSHYADSHAGVVVEYNLESQDFPRCTLEPVTYSGSRVFVEPLFFATTEPYGVELNKLILTKAVDWKYEEEFRAIVPLSRCETEARPKGVYYYLSLAPAQTRGVVLGAKATKETESAIRTVLASKTGMYLKKAGLSGTQFAPDLPDAI